MPIYNLESMESTSLNYNFQYVNDDDEPVDFTDFEARIVVKKNYSVNSPILLDESSDGTPAYITMGGVLGTIYIDVPDTVMSVFNKGKYVYVLYLIDPEQGYKDFMSGYLIIKDGLVDRGGDD